MAEAPRGPTDLAPTWTSSAKDLVTTALGASRVWATLGHGILNEVYWPSTGEPQIRDLGFIVAGPQGWAEVKRVNAYTIATPEPDVPIPTITHRGPDGSWELTLEIAPDPARDVVLIRYALTGAGTTLHALLAPRLGWKSDANTAMTGASLFATGGSAWLCLACNEGFARSSAGHVGTSDGWQDFDRNGAMTWTHERAGPGNVALMGELQQSEGTLALGFATTREGAATLALGALAEGFRAVRTAAVEGWRAWAKTVPADTASPLPDALKAEARRGAAVLKAHEDRTFPGAVVASLSVPWGASRDDLGGYHLVWPRDAVNSGLALLAIGQVEDARRMLSYLVAMQAGDGHWGQNFYPDGQAFWTQVQLDECAFPVILAAKLREDGLASPDESAQIGVGRMVRAALGFILKNGPVTAQDRWEENPGFNGYTLAVTVAALVAGADWLEGAERAYALATADAWNARIEDWIYAPDTDLARRHGVPGHYVRIVPRSDRPIAEQTVLVKNRPGGLMPAADVVALDFLALSRYGLRDPHGPEMAATVRVIDAELGRATPKGTAYYRYTGDGYGETAEGGPFAGNGLGRLWPLLAGERGHQAVQAGEDALPYLNAMVAMTGPGGMMPEQVWDTDAIPSRSLAPGLPTGSAMPLVWAHSEFIKLSLAYCTGTPVETLGSVVARYAMRRPEVEVRPWRTGMGAASIPATATLAIEDVRPFRLHFSTDGWQTVEDRASEPLPFGLHVVRLVPPAAAVAIDFTRAYDDGWEGLDHRVGFA